MQKVGRNDPCPCGSGLKYKKCCWQKEQPQKKKLAAKVVHSGSGLMQRAFKGNTSSQQETERHEEIENSSPENENNDEKS